MVLFGCSQTNTANDAMSRGKLERTGVYTTSGPQKLTDTELIWKFKTEGGVGYSLAVSGGVVYFGSEDGNRLVAR